MRRLAAAAYDLLLLGGLLMAVSFVVIFLRGGVAVAPGNLPYQLGLLTVVITFYAGFWRRGGQTLGMRAWHLRLEASDGSAVTLRQCLLRILAAVPAWAPLGLGVAWLLIDPQKLAWHDRLSGTRVVVLPKSLARS